MRFQEYKLLVESIRREAFSRQQLAELLGEVVSRICHMQDDEVKPVQSVLSDACEALDKAFDEIDAREAKFEEIEL